MSYKHYLKMLKNVSISYINAVGRCTSVVHQNENKTLYMCLETLLEIGNFGELSLSP